MTGTEALFADLAHFPLSAIQLAFTSVVFPCLLLAYCGQAAYLMKNKEQVYDAFYLSIPGLLSIPICYFYVMVILQICFEHLYELAVIKNVIVNDVEILNWFFANVAERVYWPMFIVATLAAIVASQASISATFSIINQACWRRRG